MFQVITDLFINKLANIVFALVASIDNEPQWK